MRPVMARLCTYRELKDGTLDLADIDKLNEALDVEAVNRKRFQEHRERKAKNERVSRR